MVRRRGEEVDEGGDDDGEEGGAKAEAAEAAAAAAWAWGEGFCRDRHGGKRTLCPAATAVTRRRRESDDEFYFYFIIIISFLHYFLLLKLRGRAVFIVRAEILWKPEAGGERVTTRLRIPCKKTGVGCLLRKIRTWTGTDTQLHTATSSSMQKEQKNYSSISIHHPSVLQSGREKLQNESDRCVFPRA